MHRAILTACFPWFAGVLLLTLLAALLAKLSGARLRLGRLSRLHHDQTGSVQTLSFVLTLPLFITVMMFIVQISQIMIGHIIVHYAAFAAARSAIVWIPSRLTDYGPNRDGNPISGFDSENRIGIRVFDEGFPEEIDGVSFYEIKDYGGLKFHKIKQAAALACMPIAPSRNVDSGGGTALAPDLLKAYRALIPGRSATDAAIGRRLTNKLAYSLAKTSVKITFRHDNTVDPPLDYSVYREPDLDEPYANEVGWQDPITVTVTHDMALLTGAGKLFGKNTWPISAQATLGNEGQVSVSRYVIPIE